MIVSDRSFKASSYFTNSKGLSLIETLFSIVLLSLALSVCLMALTKLSHNIQSHLKYNQTITHLDSFLSQISSDINGYTHETTSAQLSKPFTFDTSLQSAPPWVQHLDIKQYELTINKNSYYYLD